MKKKLRVVLLAIAGLLAAMAVGFFVYVSDYYRADDVAIAAMAGASFRLENNLTILAPSVPSGPGLIFYPGGKVEHTAYLPLLEQLRQNGVTCVLVEMPFRLAVFDANAADKALAALPEIETWYIGGHSLGGAMASSYAAKHSDRIQGLVLLGAYIYGDYPASKALTLYGSEDQVLDRSKITYTENVMELAGGNHAQFGSYGPQKGDGDAVITGQAQQAQTAAAIFEFMGGSNG